MRDLILLSIFIFYLSFWTIHAQNVSVNDQDYSAQALSELLIQDRCVELSNANYSSSEAVAYFQNNDGNFPLENGVILRTGRAKMTEAPYTGDSLSSQLNSDSSVFFDDVLIGEISETTFLEFEFTPLAQDFNFNFIFASNEYGQWQCVGSDSFAFILTNMNTGEQQNIAVLPNTNSQYISVKNIRDNQYNPSCNSQNPNLFDIYNVSDPANSTINMRGLSSVLNISASVQPGIQYRAKLIIADAKDAQFDSAIFVEGGSFNTSFNLGEDKKLCQGSEIDLNTSLDPNVYNHEWSYNNTLLPEENDSVLSITEIGQYSVRITKPNSNCVLTDTIKVQPLELENPGNIIACNNGESVFTYDLSSVNAGDLGLNGNYELSFYTSETEAQADNPIPQSSVENYSSSGDETIYVRVQDANTGILCDNIVQFQLEVSDPINIDSVPDISRCVDDINAPESIDLTQNNGQINGNNNYTIRFYNSETSAQNGQNRISNPTSFSLSNNAIPETIWIRVRDENGCFAVSSFQVEVNEKPRVSELEDTLVCAAYVLPPIQFGQYYTQPGGPNGNGEQLAQGDIIDEIGTYYIFNGPDENGCFNQSSFKVNIIEDFELPSQNCGPFTLPSPIADVGTYYTEPNANGTELPPGTVITESQTIYYYAEYEGEFCTDKAFPIEILPLPEVDMPDDYITCNDYTLPALDNGSYYTEPGGSGDMIAAGTVITESQTIYIFNDNGTCTNQHAFNVVIPRDYQDVMACESYELPDILGGGYYTQPAGQGEQIPDDAIITESTTIYYYAEVVETANCTENLSFDVEIIPNPEVDTLENQITCINDLYELPPLSNGDYYTRENGQGTQLEPGTEIMETQVIYIYNEVDNCSSQTQFTVEVLDFPEIPLPTNVYECGSYTLPDLGMATYYTAPGGTGEQKFAGDEISETQTLYVYRDYDELPSCFSEEAFEVIIRNAEVGEFEDINSCGPYVLPELNFGNYYSEEGRNGEQLSAGDTIYEDRTVYVFGIDGDRFPCTDEASFDVNISPVPELPDFQDIAQCGSYALPFDQLPEETEIMSGFFRGPFGQDPIDRDTLSPGVYDVYAYAQAIENPDCFEQKKFKVNVYPRPEIDIDDGAICIDFNTGELLEPYTVSTGINTGNFTVEWFNNGEKIAEGPSISINEEGTYTVQTTKLTPEGPNNCNYAPQTFRVRRSGKPVVNISTGRDFETNNFIDIEILQGNGPFEYSLDGGYFTGESIFRDVSPGTHVVKIRGADGSCQSLVREVNILNYPKFFTPNQDGFNDTWTIDDLKNVSHATIYIFTRYGKLIEVLKPDGPAWDGTYKGNQMPSDDYWFRAEYVKNEQNKVFRANFTLKR